MFCKSEIDLGTYHWMLLTFHLAEERSSSESSAMKLKKKMKMLKCLIQE